MSNLLQPRLKDLLAAILCCYQVCVFFFMCVFLYQYVDVLVCWGDLEVMREKKLVSEYVFV